MANEHIGSSFESVLEENNLTDEVMAAAVKRVVAWQVEQSRLAHGISKSELAHQRHTSRTRVDRLRDPDRLSREVDEPVRSIA